MTHRLIALIAALLLCCCCSAMGDDTPRKPDSSSAGAGGSPDADAGTGPHVNAPALALYAPECGKTSAGVALWVNPVYFSNVGNDVRLLVITPSSTQTLAPVDLAGPDTSGDFGSVRLGAGVNTLDLQARDAAGNVTRLAPADRCVIVVGQ